MHGPCSSVARYSLAVAAVVFAALFRAAFAPWLQDHSPLLPFTIAILISGLFAGFRPGLLAVVLSTAVGLAFFRGLNLPLDSVHLLPHVLLFWLLSLGILYVSEANRLSHRRLETSRRTLEARERDLQMAIEELRGAKEAAEAANLAKDRFLAVLSHELRTPLAPVLMLAESMESNPHMPEHLREDASMIRRHVALEARLIDDLLDLTRIEKGKLHLERHVVNLDEILEAAVEMVRGEAKSKGVGISVDLRADRPFIEADRARIKQVMLNLLGNALKFTPPGGSVAVLAENVGGRLRVTVSDTGIGIPREALGNIFAAFEQADTGHRRFGGLGLGLAITKSLVELHGGEVRAQSAGTGQGAAFSVTLPEAEEPQRGLRFPAIAQEPNAARLRILLVEDHEPTAFVLARLLKRRGHQVAMAATMNEAISLDRDPIDLLVSDIGLPDGTGLDVIRHYRSSQSDFRAIALSGFGMDNDVEHSLQAGFDRHLTKPVDFQTLQESISILFEKREA